MPKARKKQIDLNATPYYHCFSRCVRRGYLFGKDKESHKKYDHRKAWVVQRLQGVSASFAIQVCAYAVMSNHYHVVLHVDTAQAKAWTEDEVISRWHAIMRTKEIPTTARVEQWRDNLTSISWFMRFLNEHISRLANREDDVKGHFWESRFRCQALLDDGALLACMAYVDLNPIRSKQASTLQNSDNTSIQQRLKAYQASNDSPGRLPNLMIFEEAAKDSISTPDKKQVKSYLPFSLKDYITLVDWTGRKVREDKPGFISADLPSIVKNTGLNPNHWMKTVKHYGSEYPGIAGAFEKMRQWAENIEQSWLKGQAISRLRYLATG